MTYTILGSSCLPKKVIPVDGVLFGKPIKTTVDNELAKLMLTNPQDSQVLNLFSAYQDKPIDTKTLSTLSEKYSNDVATFYFMQKTYQNANNKQAQDLYSSYFEQLTSNNDKQALELLRGYYVVFVPGLEYTDTTNGGDFARQRRLFTASGIANEMIVTDPWGLTDDNAEIIANRLRELSKQHEKIIVVSASKGGLETAVTLGKVMKPEETKSIKAWVSIGGILKGSPVADTYLKWPKCWIAEIGLMTKGKKINLVQDVSYKKRVEDFSELRFPDNIKIVHFVGAPLATQINKKLKSLYCSIIKFGPNDGLTPLADELTENGVVVTELGFDHYYRHPEIDKKTIAMAMVVVKIQN